MDTDAAVNAARVKMKVLFAFAPRLNFETTDPVFRQAYEVQR